MATGLNGINGVHFFADACAMWGIEFVTDNFFILTLMMIIKDRFYLSGWQVGRLAASSNLPSDRSHAPCSKRTHGRTRARWGLYNIFMLSGLRFPFISVFFMGILFNAHAQTNFGKHWIFGFGNHFMFQNDSFIKLPVIDTLFCFENCAIISDSSGNPELYFKGYYDSNNGKACDSIFILGQHGNISGQSYIFSDCSVSNGINIIPNKNGYYVFYIVNYGNQFNTIYCADYKLNYAYYEKNFNGTLTLVFKDSVLTPDHWINEKLKSVKHANGKDWWIITQDRYTTTSGCSNRIIKFLVKEEGIIEGPFVQDIGLLKCNELSCWGEIAISKDGDKIAMAYADMKMIELFDFDRCTGMFSNPHNYSFNYPFNSLIMYGLEFSPNGQYLYAHGGYDPFGPFSLSVPTYRLFQFNTETYDSVQLYKDNLKSDVFQMELGLDNKIYFSSLGTCYDSIDSIYISAKETISWIENPDSAGLKCGLNLCGIKTDTLWLFGLPNMPNYDLGALSIYEADAGNDTCVPSAQTITIGKSAIAGVQYHWYNLQPANNAQQTVYVYSDTFFVVTLTDTTIKYACQTREDTIHIKVRKCDVGIDDINQISNQIKLYPNPTNEDLNIELTHASLKINTVQLTDISGKVLFRKKTTANISVADYPTGLYFIDIELSNGERVVKKVMKQ